MFLSKLSKFLILLNFLIYALCKTDKTILDYRSKFVNFQLNNETMVEVDLGFNENVKILAYVDFRDFGGDKR